MLNPMGTKGQLAQAFANILRDMWQGEMASLTPLPFRVCQIYFCLDACVLMSSQRTVCTYAKQFSGSEQHDSQEFLASLLDGLHEDLNRVLKKPYVEKPDWEGGGDKELVALAKQSWEGYMKRNDSVIVDLFQGQYQSTLVCPECSKVCFFSVIVINY